MDVLFYFSFGLLVYSYFIFPKIMYFLGKKDQVFQGFASPSELPMVCIVLAAYNEEAVIEKKIRSSLATTYPLDRLRILVGSDNSSDGTNAILERLAAEFNQLSFRVFEVRTGKPQIINALISTCESEILILTDADTFFEPETILELVKPFANPKIGGVQGHLVSSGLGSAGVVAQELTYNTMELRTKLGEGRLGAVMGAHGACYAVRKSLYVPVPKGFSVDDFFVVMQVLRQNFGVVYAKNAVCSMAISGDDALQFRRKRRMATGNYQNLCYFWRMLLPHYGVRAWVFWSHKVIRWGGWLLLATLLVSSMALMAGLGGWWGVVGVCQLLFYAGAITDYFLNYYADIEVKVLRSARHFIHMNYAMFCGFVDFLRKKTSDKW